MKFKFFMFFLLFSHNINFSFANPISLDFSFMIATVLDEDNSFCHGFFIDNHTIILPNNCNNNNITTVKKYTYSKNNSHILEKNGLLLNSSLLARDESNIALLSTKKNIYLDTLVKLGSSDKNVIIPVYSDGVLFAMQGYLKKDKIYINSNPKIKNCQIIAGTPILTTNKHISVIDFFDNTIPCSKVVNYSINTKYFLEKIKKLYNCFTIINGFGDIYKNKSICNFRYSS